MRPLTRTTRIEHNYILTIQDLLTKYFFGTLFNQVPGIDISEVFINELICIFDTP